MLDTIIALYSLLLLRKDRRWSFYRREWTRALDFQTRIIRFILSMLSERTIASAAKTLRLCQQWEMFKCRSLTMVRPQALHALDALISVSSFGKSFRSFRRRLHRYSFAWILSVSRFCCRQRQCPSRVRALDFEVKARKRGTRDFAFDASSIRI